MDDEAGAGGAALNVLSGLIQHLTNKGLIESANTKRWVTDAVSSHPESREMLKAAFSDPRITGDL